MTPFRGRVARVSFLVEAIFLDEFSPQALCPVGEKLLQAQVPQARAGLECSLSLPIEVRVRCRSTFLGCLWTSEIRQNKKQKCQRCPKHGGRGPGRAAAEVGGMLWPQALVS